MRNLLPLAFAAILPLAACGEGTPAPRAAESAPQALIARAVAENSLRARIRLPVAPQQRGVQVFAQALPDSVAVCGRSRTTSAAGGAFIPFVAVVTFEGGAPRVADFTFGDSGPEASRVFVQMVDRCFEGGGPVSARMTARAFPPLPVAGVAEVAAGPEEAAPALVAEAAASGRTVLTSARSGANIRSSAGGGEVVRTVPRSSTLAVLREAPGGWLQVAESGQPVGWIHNSLIEGAGN